MSKMQFWRLAVVAAAAWLGANASGSAQAATAVTKTVQVFATQGCDGVAGTADDGVCNRTYVIYVPNGVSANAPLHIALHGGGADGSSHMTSNAALEGRYNVLADQNKFIVVYPDGIDRNLGGGRQWNDCRGDVSASSTTYSNADDVTFISKVIDDVSAQYSVNANRVYVSGFSNGGLMAYRLYAQLGQRFAAFAATASNMPAASECSTPTERRPILITLGTSDPIMPPAGGCVSNDCARGSVIGGQATINYWRSLLGTTTSSTVFLPNTNVFDGTTVTRITYTGSPATREVKHYEVVTGGHTMPGANALPFGLGLLVGKKNRDIQNADEIVAFFQRFSR
jgi:polyhydroxybutyrate depolymerase